MGRAVWEVDTESQMETDRGYIRLQMVEKAEETWHFYDGSDSEVFSIPIMSALLPFKPGSSVYSLSIAA